MTKRAGYDPSPLRRFMADDAAQEELKNWLASEVLPETMARVSEKAEEIHQKYEIEPRLAMLAVIGVANGALNAGVKWQAAEARFAGATHAAIADALGWASSGNTLRAIPELNEITEARRTVQLSGAPYTQHIDGFKITLEPLTDS